MGLGMRILETIQSQVDAMGLPLYAVTLSAVAKPDAPPVLILHWHGFRRRTAVQVPGIEIPPRPVPGSAMQIDVRWRQVETLDEAMLEAAWRLGAWDLERCNHRPWWRLNAPVSETMACHRAFGSYPGEPDGRVAIVDAPNLDTLLELASMKGYVRWLFRPRAAGVWGDLDEDDATLRDGRSREDSCPVPPMPYDRHRSGRDVYRLGRGGRLLHE